LFAGDVFAQNELWQYYVSGGINGNLSPISSNIFFPFFNIAARAFLYRIKKGDILNGFSLRDVYHGKHLKYIC